jgi:DNA-binding transcriptional MerR regulator
MYQRKEANLSERRLSTQEAAAAVGASPNTVKSWVRDLGIAPARDEAGRHRWDDRAIAALRAVKDLRDEGRSYDTIRRLITPLDALGAEETRALRADAKEARALRVGIDEERLAWAIAEAVGQVVAGLMRAEADLAQKYANVNYELGELRATVRALECEKLGLSLAPTTPWTTGGVQ